MPPRFLSLTLEEFADLLQRFDFTRRIDTVHMHHTWRPDHAQYRGESTIEAMWRFHTRENGWRDIAQHVSIGPDGSVWTGRDWNLPPASAAGFNGNSMAGPFMFETIGDFDRGKDRLEGAQLAAVVGVIARVQERFAFGPDALRFHRSMTNLKSCPGTGVELEAIKAAVESARAELAGGARAARPADAWAPAESLRTRARTDEVLRGWRGGATPDTGARALDPMDAELEESTMSDERALRSAGVAGATRTAPSAHRGAGDGDLSPEVLAALRPHVVNLNQGRFSSSGLFATSRADVDAIFDDHLARAAAAAAATNEPLRIVFWAHGGLIDEASGLRIAHLQIAWWKRNGIYPVHFVWETGFCDALKQILAGARPAPTRGVARDIWDHTTDPVVEGIARTLGGGKIWSAMKRSAELAAAAGGGATYVAEKLVKFCQSPPCPVELHAVGHSAGSIFHAQFLPVAAELGAPAFSTLQFLAPAIRVDTFKARLGKLVGAAVRSLTMFTMKRDWEEDDNVAQIYRKSLLYLIHYALERDRETPILGLETSLRDDRDLVALFGLGGRAAGHEVVWSVSEATSGPHASTSRSHGGFDNDRPTMDAVAHRILGGPPAVTFPDEAVGRGLDLWSRPPSLPPSLAAFFATPNGDGGSAWSSTPSPGPAAPATAPPPGLAGRRRAICVGIDRYPTMPLAGCVADARDWARTFEALGFETVLLLDDEATRSRILDDLRALVAGGRPGDVLVFEFAGHGTEVPDLDGDEVDGTNGPKDEALCPYDVADGAFVIDDDLAEVFAALPEGVNLTCFIDCCHSGTITRIMVGPPGGGDRDRRARFLPVSPELEAAHRRFRERIGGRRAAPTRSQDTMRQVVFSACRDYEVAFETSGHGDFTLRATRVLASGVGGLTHEGFQARVNAAFGDGARQHPELDCAPAAQARSLLAPLVGVAGAATSVSTDGRSASAPGAVGNGDPISSGAPSAAALAQALRTIANALAPVP